MVGLYIVSMVIILVSMAFRHRNSVYFQISCQIKTIDNKDQREEQLRKYIM